MSERAVETSTSAAGVVLLTLCAGQFLMALDSSVMNVSIATVADDLDTSITGIQSAIVLYTLVMAMLMVTGGKIGSMIGRKRAFLLGLVIYCSGSLTTALAPNLAVLLFGWSILEGIGAALIMPAIVALVAGNFPPEGRPRAYGLVGAAGAIAIAVGPLIGGLATTYASWRWVFAGEVLIGAGIFLFSRRIDGRAGRGPAPPGPAGLGALGARAWGSIVIGVLKSGEWGWFLPSEDGPSVLGMSPVFWLIVAGLVTLRLFGTHIRRLDAGGRGAAVHPVADRARPERRAPDVLLPVRGDDGAVLRGPAVPLGRARALGDRDRDQDHAALGHDARSRPRAYPKFFPTTSPRRIVTIGFVAVLVGVVALLAAMDADATASIVTVPMLRDRAGAGGPRLAARAASPSRRRPRSWHPRSAGSRTRPRSSARRSGRRSPGRS